MEALQGLDIEYTLNMLLNSNRKKIEQSGGFGFIIQAVFKILEVVFIYILNPLAKKLFQPPVFMKNVPKKDTNGKPMFDEDNQPVVQQKIRLPYYPTELDGQGLFWKYIWMCVKISFYAVISLVTGVFFTMGGMIIVVYKFIKDLMVRGGGNLIDEKNFEKPNKRSNP
jgi:hypothetical protein